VLKSLNCTFEAGKTTAIVGPSGSGKSTVIQMLERFYNPESGTILFDGQDIKELDLKSVRNFMGYVGQEPILFNTTIKENMLFANRDATDEEIE
jgi:ABC-type multidrug transport system fused ATPase/permease subunit